MKLTKLIVIALALMTSSFSFGQNMHVSGTVYDSTGTRPLKNALAMAIRISDSQLLGFTRTDASGKFEMNDFGVDTFSLIIDHPEFDEKTYYIFGNEGNNDINIPSVILPSKSQEVEEVVIYAYKDPIYYKGDTLVYIADSFAVTEGAVVEELLKKLPGITIDKDGKITSQGEEISKVLVDGDEFFGSDPTIATKNLGADGIETVQIYEKENEDGIGGDDEKIKVLDLKLKDSAKKGYFGRISGASDFGLTPINGEYGTNPFYEGELLLNKFDGARKISVFALGSNTPRSSFGWGDMNKFGLENESSGGNRYDGAAKNNTSGVPRTLKAGIYFSDKFGKKKKSKFGINYSYYNDVLDATSGSISYYDLGDSTSYSTDDNIRRYTANESHKINFNLRLQLDSLTTFQIKPSFSYDKGIADNTDVSSFMDSDELNYLNTDVSDSTSSKGYTIGGFAKVNRKFMKKKRELELRYDLSLRDNESNGYLNSYTSFVATMTGDTIRQNKINTNNNTSHYGTLTYVEPIGMKMKLEFQYLFEYGYGGQNKQAFDLSTISGVYDSLNLGLTNVFDNTRMQNRAGIKFSYEPKKHYFGVTARVRNITIANLNKTTGLDVHQNINNFLPQLEYRFRPSMSKRLRINYRTSSRTPSINDLQPVLNNSNPNRIEYGNPELLPNYVHRLNAMFNTWKALTGRYIWMGGNFSYTNRAFADSTNYDSFGRTLSRTVNVNGNMTAVVYSGAGLPMFSRKITLEPGFNASFFRFSNYVSGLKNTTDNYAVTPSMKVKFSLLGDSLEIETAGSYAFNSAKSSLSDIAIPYSVQNYGVGFKWRLPHGFTISSDGGLTINSQLGENGGNGIYDTQFFVLNAEISKKFLKTSNLELALKGNDIFNQNINARREINGNVTTDYRTTIISRYFLLKLTMRFNNRKTKEEDGHGMF
ncbi:MAG: outer membrane beta-barrel protein [Crocinitomicaceae bacterium]|nr:outer membrane beta-barrel protein [Crocinitomicaceae bacterium]